MPELHTSCKLKKKMQGEGERISRKGRGAMGDVGAPHRTPVGGNDFPHPPLTAPAHAPGQVSRRLRLKGTKQKSRRHINLLSLVSRAGFAPPAFPSPAHVPGAKSCKVCGRTPRSEHGSRGLGQRSERVWAAAQRSSCRHFFPFGFPFAYWHQLASVQRSQAGLRAAQTRRPWKMSQWCARLHLSRGMCCIS